MVFLTDLVSQSEAGLIKVKSKAKRTERWVRCRCRCMEGWPGSAERQAEILRQKFNLAAWTLTPALVEWLCVKASLVSLSLFASMVETQVDDTVATYL